MSEDITVTLVQAIVSEAKRLGLVWTLRPGTVITAINNSIIVQIDGDDTLTNIPAINLTGKGVDVNQRVMTLSIPPGGLYVIGLINIGEWATYDATIGSSGTAWTLGNGSVIGRYRLIDRTTCAVHVYLTWGSTTVGGTGTPSLSLPFAPRNVAQCLSAFYRDSSASSMYSGNIYLINNSATGDNMRMHAGNGTSNVVTSTVPFIWASGDILSIQGVYELDT